MVEAVQEEEEVQEDIHRVVGRGEGVHEEGVHEEDEVAYHDMKDASGD